MTSVIATIELAEGKREAFLAEFHQLVPLVRASEAGCLAYGPTVDVGRHRARRPGTASCGTTSSRWSSSGKVWMPLRAPASYATHMAAYRPRVKEFVVGTGVQILQPA